MPLLTTDNALSSLTALANGETPELSHATLAGFILRNGFPKPTKRDRLDRGITGFRAYKPLSRRTDSFVEFATGLHALPDTREAGTESAGA